MRRVKGCMRINKFDKRHINVGYLYFLVAFTHQLGLRWFTNQIYCNEVVTVADGFRRNNKQGVTVSVQKHGGWTPSFAAAKTMAGWKSDQ